MSRSGIKHNSGASSRNYLWLSPPSLVFFLCPFVAARSVFHSILLASTTAVAMSVPMMASYAALFGLWTLTQFVLVRSACDTYVMAKCEREADGSLKMQ